jgi:hypothetical protein
MSFSFHWRPVAQRIEVAEIDADQADARVDAADAERAHEPAQRPIAGVAADVGPVRPHDARADDAITRGSAVAVNLGRNRLPIANSTLMASWMPMAVAKPTGMLWGARDR